jgi:hypothetical protein
MDFEMVLRENECIVLHVPTVCLGIDALDGFVAAFSLTRTSGCLQQQFTAL